LQLAICDGVRKGAFKGGAGTCQVCNARVIAKCGPRVIHHWAHASRRDCDPWWENETAWHREWKNLFPEECREISHVAPDGEIHRADLKTPRGIVIEIQHSQMTDAERLSREAFYGNLVWIVDGRSFRRNFSVFHALPDPRSELAQDLVWAKATVEMRGAAYGMFFRISENLKDYPGITKATLRGGWIHGIHEIEDQVRASYRGHHQYDWMRPRRTWLDAQCPVFIDFGTPLLVKLEVYDESGLPCVRHVPKERFVADAMNLISAREIGAVR
jgi:competence CoiA-like predicted nuclease